MIIDSYLVAPFVHQDSIKKENKFENVFCKLVTIFVRVLN